ncbi:MAG: redox-regulated ATPase YchF [Bacteroidota bacterium]
MSLKYGIVGLPNVGKSTLFSALAKVRASAENYPFCTIDPQVGMVSVPDERLEELAAIVQPKKVIPTTLSFVDIAGLVKGASQGEGLGNKFLANIREVDAILHVIRCFDNPEITHVEENVDPLVDKAIIDEELQLKDKASLQKRKENLTKLIKTGKKEIREEYELVEKCENTLAQGQNLRDTSFTEKERLLIDSWHLLTTKPIIYVANVDEKTLQQGTNHHVENLRQQVQKEEAPLILLCAALEADIAMAPEEEQAEFLAMYQLKKTGLAELIQTSYRWIGLITYFTAGEQEVRAWTIKKGTLAPQAAGVIHSDFEKGFIKAEVIKLNDYLQYKDVPSCKQAGKQALEGKNYEVQDGDVIYFKTAS